MMEKSALYKRLYLIYLQETRSMPRKDIRRAPDSQVDNVSTAHVELCSTLHAGRSTKYLAPAREFAH